MFSTRKMTRNVNKFYLFYVMRFERAYFTRNTEFFNQPNSVRNCCEVGLPGFRWVFLC